MPAHGFDRLMAILPRRQVVIPCLVGAVGLGSLTGLIMGAFGPTSSDQTATAFRPPVGTTSATGAPSATASASASGSASPTASASPSSTATVKVITGSPDVPPTAFIDQPWSDPSMQFATLQDVQRDDNGSVVVQVRLGRLLTGGAARRYLVSQGQDPADFAVVDQSGGTQDYTLRDDATIFSQYYLGDHTNVNTMQLDPDQFYDAARAALGAGVQPTIWLRHDYGIDSGPVIYLAEQYLPAATSN